MQQIDPEHNKPNPKSSLDDVHTAPYEEFAARILADEALGSTSAQSEHPLSSVLRETVEDSETKLEPGSKEYVELEFDRFFDEVEEIRAQGGRFAFEMGIGDFENPCGRNDFEVAFDPETNTYCIRLKSSPDSNDIVISVNKRTFNISEPLHIPTSLRGVARLVNSNYPLATVPDIIGYYKVWGVEITSIAFPRSVDELTIEDTNIVDLPDFPHGVKRLSLAGNIMLKRLPDLPTQLISLEFGSNRGLRYETDQLPKSLESLTIRQESLYTTKERWRMGRQGIKVYR